MAPLLRTHRLINQDLMSGDILQEAGELTVMWWEPRSQVLPPLCCM